MAPTDTVIAVARFEGTDETVTFRPPPQGYAAVCHGFVGTHRASNARPYDYRFQFRQSRKGGTGKPVPYMDAPKNSTPH